MTEKLIQSQKGDANKLKNKSIKDLRELSKTQEQDKYERLRQKAFKEMSSADEDEDDMCTSKGFIKVEQSILQEEDLRQQKQ